MTSLKEFIFSVYWRPSVDAYKNLLEILDDLYLRKVFLNVQKDKFLQKHVKFMNKILTNKITSIKGEKKRDW